MYRLSEVMCSSNELDAYSSGIQIYNTSPAEEMLQTTVDVGPGDDTHQYINRHLISHAHTSFLESILCSNIPPDPIEMRISEG